MWSGYKNYDHFFQMNGLSRFLEEVHSSLKEVSQLTVNKKSIEYYNIPASFDIETTSTYIDGEKFACMYIWQLGINGSVIIGREWSEFLQVLAAVKNSLDVNLSKRLIIYVHNLSFEFQFIRKRIQWVKQPDGEDAVFSLKPRKPIYALSKMGFEFRCSYIYSNYALAYVGASLIRKYKVTKKLGDLVYSLVRHPGTPMTDAELGYSVDDVRVVMSYIQEEIEYKGDISRLTLTNTGKVREYCRGYCFGEYERNPDRAKKKALEYHAIMKSLRIRSSKEYDQLKRAFAGGFTHAASFHSCQLMKNVGSADLTSSYPSVMCYQYFPMSSCTFIGKVEEQSKFYNLLENYCCLFDVRFYNIYQEFEYESYISYSKCDIIKDEVVNNGRVSEAAVLQMTCTELDFKIISMVYDWSEMEIFNMRIYDKGYLPRSFIESILGLYEKKTSLKGVKEKEVEYMVSKNMINSTFGMAVTDIVRDDAVYIDNEWTSIEGEAVSQLTDYNSSYSRFLFYPWGVWVTAHARYNLWQAILEFAYDYVYADTDSIKGINFEAHKLFFARFNARVRTMLYDMCEYYKIPIEKVEPLTQDGKPKLLGVWDIEEGYRYFKTMGAKRYMYEHESGEFNHTVSGVNKRAAVPYLLSEYCGFPDELARTAYSSDPNKKDEAKAAMKELIKLHEDGLSYAPAFAVFDQALEIPAGRSGKLTHTYIDEPRTAYVTDYLGNSQYVTELSSTHLEPAPYSFSMSQQYLDFLLGIRQNEA